MGGRHRTDARYEYGSNPAARLCQLADLLPITPTPRRGWHDWALVTSATLKRGCDKLSSQPRQLRGSLTVHANMRRLVIFGLVLLPAGCKKEPTFQDKPKSYWLRELKSGSSTAAVRAANAIGHFAPEAKEAIPDLIRLLDDGKPLVRWAAADALGKFGREARDAVPALMKLAADDPEAAVRSAAGSALAQIGSQEKDDSR